MFEKLRIQNFQSHKDTLLEFVPGINIIIGTSDSGKSAIFRALKWLMYNRPTGDSFCSHWSEKSARVELTLDNHRVVRAREKSKQIYELDDLSFTAFKTDVPEEIVTALNMGDVNFQQQFDRPFLLDISAGEVAQYFNKIAHLESIDKVIKSLHQTERTVKRNLEWYSGEKVKVEAELEKYTDLELLDQKVFVLEKAQETITEIENEVEELTSIIFQMGQLQEVLKASSSLGSFIDVINETIILQEEYAALSLLMEQIESLIYEIEEYTGIDDCLVFLTDMIGIAQNIKETEIAYKQMKVDVQSFSTLKDTINNIISNIEVLDTKLKKEMPAVCPLCGKNTI